MEEKSIEKKSQMIKSYGLLKLMPAAETLPLMSSTRINVHHPDCHHCCLNPSSYQTWQTIHNHGFLHKVKDSVPKEEVTII